MDFKNLLKYSLSDRDITRFFNDKIKIIRYSELDDYDNIVDVLKPYNRTILLIEAEKTNHWVLLQMVKDKFILFFDSYGIFPSNQYNYIPKSIQKMTNQDRNKLLRLLIDSPYNVHYSQYRFQKIKNYINTCGRWCCVKGLFMDMTEDDFRDMINNMMKETKLTSDEVICLLYEELNN